MDRRAFLLSGLACAAPAAAQPSSEQYGLVEKIDSAEAASRAQLLLHVKATEVARKAGKRIHLDTCEWLVLPPHKSPDDPLMQGGYVALKWRM